MENISFQFSLNLFISSEMRIIIKIPNSCKSNVKASETYKCPTCSLK